MKFKFNSRLFGVILPLLIIFGGMYATMLLAQLRPRTLPAPAQFTISQAKQGTTANATTVTFTPKDANGNAISGLPFDIFFSDSAACAGVTATAASGTSGINSTFTAHTQDTDGIMLRPSTGSVVSQTAGGSAIAWNAVQTKAAGVVKFEITDSGKTNWFPCAYVASTRQIFTGAQMTTALFQAFVLPWGDFDVLEAKAKSGLLHVWAWLWFGISGGGVIATAPIPRIKKIGTMVFARNAYGLDLFGPQGGLPLEDYDEIWCDYAGSLTIAGGTTDGVPTSENPETTVKSVEVRVTGSTLADSFKEIPLLDLQVHNLIADSSMVRSRGGIADFADANNISRTRITTGAVGVYPFRTFFRIPFAHYGMDNPKRFYFPMNRYGQVQLRIKFGTEEDIVAGGDRTKTISAASQITFYGVSWSFDSAYDTASDLFFNQHVAVKNVAVPNQAQVDQDYEITRTASFLKSIVLRTYTMDANGVETPTDQLIRSTDQLGIRLNDESSKAENMTAELWRFLNASHYIRPIPFGYYVLDFSPQGDEDILKRMMMSNFSSIKVRANNGALANANIRISVNKFSVAA